MKQKKMNKKEKQALSNYIRMAADLLWLRDWDFDVYYENPQTPERAAAVGQEWGAVVEQTRHRQHACITLTPYFRYHPAYQGNNGKVTIAHELIHMHWARCWDQVRVDLLDTDGLAQQTYDLFIANYERNMEYGVDALAEAFAKYLPDIDWESND